MSMYRRKGIGAYPSDTCFYDPGRPWYVPYFIDTPTESQNKIACTLLGTPTTLTPITWAIPGVSAVGPLVAPFVATPTNPPADQASGDLLSSALDDLANKLKPNITIPNWVMWTGLAIAGLLGLNLVKGGLR